MRVPDEFLDAVFFLAIDRVQPDGSVRPEYAGTGFYMAVKNEFDSKLRRLYFVTARHCIEGSQREPGELYVRVNLEAGGSILGPVSKTDWTFHSDASIDIAVMAPTFAVESEHRLLHAYVEADTFLTPELIDKHGIGIGSDVTAVGLFSPRQGVDRNTPVVRAGVISAMPGEPIDDGTAHGPHYGYLVEILSMSGLSGSPVFVHPIAGPHHRHPMRRLGGGRVEVVTAWEQSSFLLGIVRSHWDERPPDPSTNLRRIEWINRGIAAVTPIGGVLDVLNSAEFQDQRKQEALAEGGRGDRGS